METVFDESSAIDAEISERSADSTPKIESGNFTNQAVEDLLTRLAEKFFESLRQKDQIIEQKDQLIGELRAEVSENDRRLKLSPDLQKQAEDERKAAELKDLEVEALRKQMAAPKGRASAALVEETVC